MGKRAWMVAVASVVLVVGLMRMSAAEEKAKPAPDSEEARIVRGYQIAPVPLNLKGRNRALVGLGSYIVNAQAACNDCHTNPPWAPGHNPFLGQPKQVNVAGYLAGGTDFGGGIISANITPDDDGFPAGLTFQEYKDLIRTGHDPDEPGELLQVMPWPILGNMNDRDIKAVYEYLSAIPHIEGGDD